MTLRQDFTGGCFLVVTNRPWQIDAFQRHAPALPGQWRLISEPADVTVDRIMEIAPDRIFFPHWSERIPAIVYERWECVLFHMTDLPYGRGGSPLQNLIQRGHSETVMTALRVVGALDAGPVYLKRPMSLTGTAREIFERSTVLIWEMIDEIVRTSPEPVPQVGEPTVFKRRRPEDSQLPQAGDITALFDHIRMLDADGYPLAYIDHGAYRLEFEGAEIDGDRLRARVTVSRHSSGSPSPVSVAKTAREPTPCR